MDYQKQKPFILTFQDLPEVLIRMFLLFGICPKHQSKCFYFSGFARSINPSVFTFRNLPEASIRMFLTFQDLPEASIQVFLLFGICPKRKSECF
ncbi:hypothetical protein [Capnocytophaga cynodegmi]|uniref:hypothetical protein n=1 Tax=Capnocytophaga cynodegmi TaxID=28189 RepID=UPI0018E3A6CE|nr:hypothetical protein [Capnocytophaga cynodegmi]